MTRFPLDGEVMLRENLLTERVRGAFDGAKGIVRDPGAAWRSARGNVGLWASVLVLGWAAGFMHLSGHWVRHYHSDGLRHPGPFSR